MKLIFLGAALSAMTLLAQDAKVQANAVPPTPSTERPLSETEVLKLQLTQAKAQVLQDRFKIQDFQKEMAPINAEQMAVVQAACLSVGVEKEKIQTDCGIVTGFDGEGKTVIGADGKPVVPRVWKQPKAPPVTQTTTTTTVNQ